MPQPAPVARVLGPTSRIGGKYSLVKRLAHGGMGDVWLAKNETTQAHVALKVLRPAADERTQAEDRFRREARLGGLLAHRSIVRIFDLLEEKDGTLVLVMELLRGETLEQFIERRGALSTREALAIAVSMLSALQHGHDQGVVHRDVKPSNIFLAVEPDGHVLPKLLDYGIAKMPKSDSKTIDGLVLGTPSYMSPEQIRSEDAIDGRSDQFSAAVCIYEMLTGTCPFQAPTPSAAIAAVLQNAVDPDPRIEPKMWLELQRALSKRPKQRHESCAQLASALCAAAGESEESLATALRGVAPRDGPPQSGAVPSGAAREHETQSVQGQSVASRPLRRGAGWVPWALAGTVVGVVAVIAATTLHGRPPAAAVPAGTSATNVRPTATAAAVDPSPPPTSPATASQPPATAQPPSETQPSTASPPPSSPHHHRAKPHAPRPLATSPGF